MNGLVLIVNHEWVTRDVAVNYPSDGLLPQYTQEIEDIPEGNKYKVSGANHIEVRDMTHNRTDVDETYDEFVKIFDRDVSDFFYIERN